MVQSNTLIFLYWLILTNNLFADDTNLILTSYDASELRRNCNEVFNIINKWFYSNLLMLNYTKTYFLQFQAKAINGDNKHILHINEKFATVELWNS